MTTTDVGVAGDSIVDVGLKASMMARRPQHPALARLHDQLVDGRSLGEITSYDRMHHRHNRS